MILEKEFVMRLINEPSNIGKTAIKPKDIGVKAYRAAYQELLSQLKDGGTPSLLTIVDGCPGHEYLLAEMNSIEKANFKYYENKLSNDIQRRRLQLAKENFTAGLESLDSPKDIIEKLEEDIASSWVEADHRSIKSLYTCALEFGPVLEKRHELKGALPGIPTGFERLNSLTGGFQPGTYYIGARPSQGKTALMLTMMRAAMKAGHGAGLISIESSDIELISRTLSAEAQVNASALKHGAMTASDYPKLKEAYSRIKGFNGQVYFNTKTDIPTLEATARVMVKNYGIEILFIDYLQRINAKGGTKFEQVLNASRAVTDIAKGLSIPVVCLVQTGRVADSEAPSLNHFQYSSAIEQDADVAIIINNKSMESGPEISELCVLKNRDGEVGDVPVFFNRRLVMFEQIANPKDR